MKYKTLILILIALFFYPTITVAQNKEYLPIYVLIARQKKSTIINKTPEFVLYENGQIIYKNKNNCKDKCLKTIMLTKNEFQFLTESNDIQPLLRTIHTVYSCQEGEIIDSELVLFFWDNVEKKHLECHFILNIDKLPQPVFDIVEFMLNYENNNSTYWLPEEYHITLEKNGTSKFKKNYWPECFPPLDSISFKSEKESITFNVLENMCNNYFKLKNKRIIINGNKYNVIMRPVFPLEKLWRTDTIDI